DVAMTAETQAPDVWQGPGGQLEGGELTRRGRWGVLFRITKTLQDPPLDRGRNRGGGVGLCVCVWVCVCGCACVCGVKGWKQVCHGRRGWQTSGAVRMTDGRGQRVTLQ